MDSKTFQSDSNVDIRLVGSPLFLSPFAAQLSSQRGEMLSSNAPSVMVVDGAEYPHIYSCLENKLGKYQFTTDGRDRDCTIEELIPKFRSDMQYITNENPKITVIYRDDLGRIGYFDIDKYTELSHGFGYRNKLINDHLLQRGQMISKDTKFTTAPNHDDELYNMGVNVNVCFLPYDTQYGTNTNDSFAISSRVVEKTTHTVIEKIEIDIGKDQTPLDLYGKDGSYRVMPNVGEKVRDDGYLFALRDTVDYTKSGPTSNRNRSSFLSDVTGDALSNPEPLHDMIYKTHPGATVVDVEIFTNHKLYMSLNGKSNVYSQLMAYQDQYYKYWAQIIDVYEKYRAQGCEFTEAFMNFVTYCKGWCYIRGGKSMTLMNKKEEVETIHMTITVAYTRTPSRGFKYVGRYGNKGTVSSVIPLEKMPRTPDGDYVDILIPGDSPFNRLNEGQHYEQAINSSSRQVVEAIKRGHRIDNNAPLPDIESKYEYLLEYIGDVRPLDAQLVREQVGSHKEQFVNEVISQGVVPIACPPFTKSIKPDIFLMLHKKYGLEHKPLTYWTYDENGNQVEKKTAFHHIVGSMYLWLLGKLPEDALNAVEASYVNQFNIPIKPKAKVIKFQSIIRRTPNRYGEDEVANLTATIGPEATARLMSIYATSPAANELLFDTILNAENPSCIVDIPMSTKDCIDTCANISLLKHQLGVIGYNLKTIKHRGDENGNITPADTDL